MKTNLAAQRAHWTQRIADAEAQIAKLDPQLATFENDVQQLQSVVAAGRVALAGLVAVEREEEIGRLAMREAELRSAIDAAQRDADAHMAKVFAALVHCGELPAGLEPVSHLGKLFGSECRSVWLWEHVGNLRQELGDVLHTRRSILVR